MKKSNFYFMLAGLAVCAILGQLISIPLCLVNFEQAFERSYFQVVMLATVGGAAWAIHYRKAG